MFEACLGCCSHRVSTVSSCRRCSSSGCPPPQLHSFAASQRGSAETVQAAQQRLHLILQQPIARVLDCGVAGHLSSAVSYLSQARISS